MIYGGSADDLFWMWDLSRRNKCFVIRWNSDLALSLLLEPEMGTGVELGKGQFLHQVGKGGNEEWEKPEVKDCLQIQPRDRKRKQHRINDVTRGRGISGSVCQGNQRKGQSSVNYPGCSRRTQDPQERPPSTCAFKQRLLVEHLLHTSPCSSHRMSKMVRKRKTPWCLPSWSLQSRELGALRRITLTHVKLLWQ